MLSSAFSRGVIRVSGSTAPAFDASEIFQTAKVTRKFYRRHAALNLPLNFDPDSRRYPTERARAKGVKVGELVNDLLK